jgi:hypothetical protein
LLPSGIVHASTMVFNNPLPKIISFLKEANRRNPLLYGGAIANLVLFVIMALLFFFDERTVSGINTWIKPMKFTSSFFIFLLTFAWLLFYLPNDKTRKILSWGFFICMVMEVLTIVSQGARGVKSHFNVHTAYDGIIFMIMGIFIFINTLLAAYTIILFFRKTKLTNPAYILAWRAGLLIFFLGAISGGMMVGHQGHAYGVAEGGPGLPFFNWSTEGGDMRTAHFLTLHAVQVLPLFVFFVGSKLKNPKFATGVFALIYSGICFGLHWMALQGMSLFGV